MKKKCVWMALAVVLFSVCLFGIGYSGERADAFGETAQRKETAGAEGRTTAVAQMTEESSGQTDLSVVFDVILQGATKEFIAGYPLDEAFLMWLDAVYGDETIIQLAYCVLDDEMEPDFWYELTGNSMHVLWLLYCQQTGFQSYQLKNVHWKECRSTAETVVSFTGDFNFADGWCTTEYMEEQENGIYDCFSEPLLTAMNASDILVMNNEFTYTDRGEALEGKDYTFRADPKKVELLEVFGTDLVVLANNHTYDYGEIGLLDTLDTLEQAGMPYSGAGRDMDEASKIVYFVANGRKIAIVSATEIERTIPYTRQATEESAGVLKTLHPEIFLSIIEQADVTSDYTIVVSHWGPEGTLHHDAQQGILAEQFVQAGADVVIGGHPHRLQGVEFIDGAPVAYSVGNFWFSDATLYTTVAQVVIAEDGELTLRYLPCVQKDLTTSLITDTTEKEDFYHYLAAISKNVGIDAEGNVYDKASADYPTEQIQYDSDTSTTGIWGGSDNEGNAIDIVGNLK